jgi:CRISPR/Cas system CSM-associated protein Csm3 (group 7 of RAMP superfamily)
MVVDLIRVTYTLSFETASELHVGSGVTEPRRAIQGDEPQGEIARFVIDHRGHAWIPGSTLKGAFVAQFGERFERLFGQAHAKGVDFAQGELTFFGLSTKTPGLRQEKVRTAVDQGTGASAAQKLFAQDYMFKGAAFSGDLVLQCSSDRLEKARDEVLKCLNRFARAEGIPIGAGKADGLGRIRLTNATERVERLTAAGWATTASAKAVALSKEPDEEWQVFDLTCLGPYMVGGPVVDEGAGEKTHKVTHAERLGDRTPRLFPTGVAGALRARAQWLAELDALRAGTALESTARPVKTSAGEVPLTVVQRLFGDQGYRASLAMKVEHVPSNTQRATEHPAGPLDPVLQMPKTVLDDKKQPKGTLHRRNADSLVKLRLSLRMWRKDAQQDELDLFAALQEDIKTNGLPLGLGTAKGFGWFGIEPTQAKPSPPKRTLNKELEPESQAKLPAREVKLPYRQIEVDPGKIGMPEEVVLDAHDAGTLLSKPLPNGLSGWVDVSWCFETPMLVGDVSKAGPNLRFSRNNVPVDPALQIRAPQYLDKTPVIPGTTLRGAMRSLIETVTSARLGTSRMSPYRLDDGDNRTDYPFLSAAEEWRRLELHSPPFDGRYLPDFTDALFGFISPDRRRLSPELHARLHLKSRVSFGWAQLVSPQDTRAGSLVHSAVMLSPRVGSVFMDHVSRRVYPATLATSEKVLKALAQSLPKPAPDGQVKNEDTISHLRFLHPVGQQPLVFRGRIRFHNVTQVELGALMWAITLGMKPELRHMIGAARAFGAGRCYATDLRIKLNWNNGASPKVYTSDLTREYGDAGPFAEFFVDAFDQWIDKNGLRTHGFHERLAAADPAYGQAMADQSGGFTYQTHEMFRRERLRNPTALTPAQIATKNGVGLSGKGRLAAVLRRS